MLPNYNTRTTTSDNLDYHQTYFLLPTVNIKMGHFLLLRDNCSRLATAFENKQKRVQIGTGTFLSFLKNSGLDIDKYNSKIYKFESQI